MNDDDEGKLMDLHRDLKFLAMFVGGAIPGTPGKKWANVDFSDPDSLAIFVGQAVNDYKVSKIQAIAALRQSTECSVEHAAVLVEACKNLAAREKIEETYNNLNSKVTGIDGREHTARRRRG